MKSDETNSISKFQWDYNFLIDFFFMKNSFQFFLNLKFKISNVYGIDRVTFEVIWNF
jgi:hypothetical protein